MKKTIILLSVAALAVVGSYVVFAEDPMGGGMMGRGMRGGPMMDSNDMMMQRRMMGGPMMGGYGGYGGYGMHPMSGMMGGSSLAATEDGGAIVLIGNKLMKYDKDLNLAKEVEIKIDWEKMNKTMMEHHKMMMGTSSGTENK